MSFTEELAITIFIAILLLPIYVIVLSMSAYIGKVWAIKLLFKKERL